MSDKNDFFIGWADETPSADRRVFLTSGLAMIAGAAALGGALSVRQRAAGPGSWDQGDIREWRGIVTSEPFPMLRFLDDTGNPRTALLSCMGKCAVKLVLGAYAGKNVIVRGSPIVRGPHLMIATADDGSWIKAAEGNEIAMPTLAFPDYAIVGDVSLKGKILDTKCWFGAMRPGEGKPHKACASLCIRGGLAPGFYVKSLRAQSRLMLLVNEHGQSLGEAILPLVADPVHIVGTVMAFGDLLYLRAPLGGISRI